MLATANKLVRGIFSTKEYLHVVAGAKVRMCLCHDTLSTDSHIHMSELPTIILYSQNHSSYTHIHTLHRRSHSQTSSLILIITSAVL